METLSSRHCVPCHGGVPRLTAEEIAPLLSQLRGWDAIEEHHLTKDYKFPNFADSLAFVNLGGEDEVAFAQAPDGVGVDLEAGVAPAEGDVGVVTL